MKATKAPTPAPYVPGGLIRPNLDERHTTPPVQPSSLPI
jgi:hypothetical protein